MPDFDPFAQGLATAEPTAEFDPFAAGLAAEEEPAQSTLANAGGAFARGVLDQGAGAGVEGAARIAAEAVPDLKGMVPGSDTMRKQRELEDLQAQNKRILGMIESPEGSVGNLLTPADEAQIVANERRILELKGQATTAKAASIPGKMAAGAAEFREGVREVYPVNAEFEQSLAGQIISGLGQAAGTLPLYAVPGAGPGITVGQLYQQGVDDAKSKGADEATANRAGFLNIPAAALDVASDRLIIGRVLRPLKGRVTVGQVIKAIGTSSGAEGTTEGAQQTWQNHVAKELAGYDPARTLDDQVIRSMVVGAAVGGIISGAGQAATATRGPRREARAIDIQATEVKDQALSGEAAAAFDPFVSGEAVETPVPADFARNETLPEPDDFADVTPAEIFGPRPPAAPEGATGPGVGPADSVPAGGEPTQPAEGLTQAVAERSGEAETAAAPVKRKPAFRIGGRADGVMDVLDAIQEVHGIRPPSVIKEAGGEYDGFKDVFGRGLPRLLVRKSAGTVEQVMAELEEMGFAYETPDAFYNAVKVAVEGRKKVLTAVRADQDQQNFAAAIYENQGRRGAKIAKVVNTDSLNVGARFAVKGEPFEVVSVDPDSGDVTVRDGPRYGTQVLPAATPVYLDPKSLRVPNNKIPAGDVPFAARREDPGQRDMFGGGETGGDKLFNLQGEQRDAATAAWSMDEELARREAIAKGQKDQGDLQFVQREALKIETAREQLLAKQAEWRAAAKRLAPGLMQRFQLQFGDPEILVRMGKARPEDITPHVQAAYLARERMFFLFDQALAAGSDLNTRLNLVHEMAHAHWDTLPEPRQALLLQAWRSETEARKGPLYGRGGQLRRGVARGVENSVKEWYAERIAWTNQAWARRRAAPADSVLGRLADDFRAMLEQLRSYWQQLRGRDMDQDFRAFLDEGERFDSTELPVLQPAAARAAEMAQRTEDAGRGRLRARWRDFQRDAGAWMRRELTSAAGLPADVFKRKLAKDARLAAIAKQAEFTLGNFDRALHAVYGGYRAMTAAQLQQINNVLGGKATLDTLDPRLQEPVGLMRTQIDVLSRRLVREGAIAGNLAAAVDGNLGFYLHRSYRKFDDPKWAARVPVEVRNSAASFIRAELQAQQPLLTVDEKEVQGYLEYLLAKDVDGPEAFFRPAPEGAKDLRIFTKRKEIPAEIRELLGEYQDPRVNYLRSVSKTAQVLESHRFLQDVRTAGSGRWLFPRPIADETGKYATLIAAKGSEAMAPLNGLYTTKEFAQAFQQHFSQLDDAWRWWLRLNSWTKVAKTVLSPMTQARNFLGNLGFMVANGHWRADAAADVWKMLRTEFAGDRRGREYVTRLTRLGVLGDSVNYGELREALSDAGAKVTGIEEFTDSRLVRAIKSPFALAGRIYRTNDDIFKVYAFENERRAWTAALPSLAPAEIDVIAADRVRNTVPTYSLIPRLAQRVRRYGLTGSFLSWPSEIIRTGYHTLRYTVQDLQSRNPAVRRMGMKRALGVATAAGLAEAVQMISAAKSGIDAEDDKDLREFLPKWVRNANLLYQGTDGKGRFQLIDASYMDPWSYLKKPLRAALAGEDWQTALIEAAAGALEPFAGEGLVTAAVLDLARNRDKNGRQVYNEALPWLDRAQEQLAHVWKAVEPGFVTQSRRIIAAARGEVGSMGRAYDLEEELAAVLTGARSQSIDVAQSYLFRAKQFAGERGAAERIYTDLKHRTGNVDPEDLAAAKTKMEQARRELFENMSRQTAAALRLGIGRGDVARALLGAGLAERDIGLIMSGRYVPYIDTAPTKARILQRQILQR